jgi:hypothetical protein
MTGTQLEFVLPELQILYAIQNENCSGRLVIKTANQYKNCLCPEGKADLNC